MTHPEVTPHVTILGTVAGYPVETVTLPGTWHPEQPRPRVDTGGFQRWVRVGAAPWTRADRLLPRWLDPDGSPWTLADLPDVLCAMNIPEIEDVDWPTPHSWSRHCPLPDHFEACLPAAQKAAAARYVEAIIGDTACPDPSL